MQKAMLRRLDSAKMWLKAADIIIKELHDCPIADLYNSIYDLATIVHTLDKRKIKNRAMSVNEFCHLYVYDDTNLNKYSEIIADILEKNRKLEDGDLYKDDDLATSEEKYQCVKILNDSISEYCRRRLDDEVKT